MNTPAVNRAGDRRVRDLGPRRGAESPPVTSLKGAARAILQHLGLAAGVPAATPHYDCADGSTAGLAGRPTVLDSDGAPDWDRDPVVVSLARWDRIKDPLGVLDGFLERALAATGAHLLLAGPDPGQVADDPRGRSRARRRARTREAAAAPGARAGSCRLPAAHPG